MGDPIPTMPSFDALCKTKFSPQEWLMYYRNVWMRNLTARSIDMAQDTAAKLKNPEEQVPGDDGTPMAVKVRLEHRKILVQDALTLIATIDALLLLAPADFEAKMWTPDALKVAEDMIPKPPPAKAGDPCIEVVSGQAGTFQTTADGLVCVPNPSAPAPEKPSEPTPAPAVTP